jgi:hypothetical protein
MMRPFVIVSALSVLATAPLTAQICRGLPDLATTALSASVDAAFGRNSSVVSGSVAGGRPSGLFASAGALVQSFDDLFLQSAPGAQATVGWEFAKPGAALSFCPVVGAIYEHGPNVNNLRLRSTGGLVGGYVGYRFDPLNPMGLSAFLGLTAGQLRTTGTLAGTSASTSNDVQTLVLGGVLPNRAGFVVSPFVSIPLQRGSESVLGLRFSWRLSLRDGDSD